MPKKVPNYIKQNLYATAKYMDKVIELNKQFERWAEKAGLSEFGSDYSQYLSGGEHYCPGYVFSDIEYTIEQINEDLESGTDPYFYV